MKKYILFFFFSIYATIASANDTILGYIEWIVQNSDFEYNNEPLPTIEVKSYNEIQLIGYGEEAIAESIEKNYELTPLIALYKDRIIIVNENFDLNDFRYHHILVHELVHYLQEINNINDDCIQNLEPIAYELQTQWMIEVNHPEPLPDRLFIAFLSLHCITNGRL
jgi:hypothetical protein